MLKKVVTYILIILTLAIFASYFVFASRLKEKEAKEKVCDHITVTILDSMINRFVSPNDVKNIMLKSDSNPIGKQANKVNIHDLEILLNKRSAIRQSDVSVDREGHIRVSITQRRPVLRIQSQDGGFYVDDTKYIFPLENTFTSYVPIVTGNIPLKLEPGYRGEVKKDDSKWMNDIVLFGEYIDRHPFWNAQILQINIEENQDVTLYTRVGNQTIIFGPLEDIRYKFAKLDAYYQNIVPIYGWQKYSSINLKYSDQIVCTLKKNSNKHKSI